MVTRGLTEPVTDIFLKASKSCCSIQLVNPDAKEPSLFTSTAEVPQPEEEDRSHQVYDGDDSSPRRPSPDFSLRASLGAYL